MVIEWRELTIVPAADVEFQQRGIYSFGSRPDRRLRQPGMERTKREDKVSTVRISMPSVCASLRVQISRARPPFRRRRQWIFEQIEKGEREGALFFFGLHESPPLFLGKERRKSLRTKRKPSPKKILMEGPLRPPPHPIKR